MEHYIVPAVAFVLCLVSFYLMLRDVDEHGLGENLSADKAKRTAMIYGIIMTVITVALSVFVVLFYKSNTLFGSLRPIALLCVMWPVALIDLKTLRIPNKFILFGVACIAIIVPLELIFAEQGKTWSLILSKLIAAGALLLASLLCALLIKNSIGFGDIKLFLIMGLLLGLEGIWSAVFCSLFVSFVISVFLLATKKKTRKDAIPFGPALVIGTYLSVFLTGM